MFALAILISDNQALFGKLGQWQLFEDAVPRLDGRQWVLFTHEAPTTHPRGNARPGQISDSRLPGGGIEIRTMGPCRDGSEAEWRISGAKANGADGYF